MMYDTYRYEYRLPYHTVHTPYSTAVSYIYHTVPGPGTVLLYKFFLRVIKFKIND